MRKLKKNKFKRRIQIYLFNNQLKIKIHLLLNNKNIHKKVYKFCLNKVKKVTVWLTMTIIFKIFKFKKYQLFQIGNHNKIIILKKLFRNLRQIKYWWMFLRGMKKLMHLMNLIDKKINFSFRISNKKNLRIIKVQIKNFNLIKFLKKIFKKLHKKKVNIIFLKRVKNLNLLKIFN